MPIWKGHASSDFYLVLESSHCNWWFLGIRIITGVIPECSKNGYGRANMRYTFRKQEEISIVPWDIIPIAHHPECSDGGMAYEPS